MIAPEAQQAGDNASTFAGFAVIFVVGAILTYKGYGPARPGPARALGR